MDDAASIRPSADVAAFGLDETDRWIDIFREATTEGETPAREGRWIGEYRVLAEVARGGQGVVYRARRDGAPHDVAVKRLVAGAFATDAMRRRFEREAEAAAALDHAGIVRLIEVGLAEREPVLVMEWVEGEPISRWAAGTGDQRRAPREIVAMMLGVCAAVSHAHRRGVIHRDLKPSNIFVDTSGRARVLDFGLAKLAAPGEDTQPLTLGEQFVGTLAYAAPEQIGSAPPDVRADVYALGVVFHEMLTGRTPHPACGSLAEMLDAIRRLEPAPPSAFRAGVAPDLDAVTLKALAKEPDDRYASVDAFAAELERWLRGESVLARRPRRIERAARFIRRNRAWVAGGTSLCILIAGLAAAATASAMHSSRERARAEAALVHRAAAERTARRVADFLQQSLAAARPGEQGGEVTVLAMLERAAVRAESELADEPAVAAEVFYSIGFTYRSLWMFSEGAAHLDRAAKLSRESFGNYAEHTAKCLLALGTCLANTSDPRGIEVSREALEIRERAPEPDPALIAEAHMRLGYALYRAPRPARFRDAERQLLAGLALYEQALGPTHRDTAQCLHNLAYMRWRQGRTGEAAELYERAINAFRIRNDRQDPSYAEALTGFASLLEKQGRLEESLALNTEVAPLLRDLYGEWYAYRYVLRRARLLSKLDRRDEAEPVFREALAIGVRQWCREQPESAAALMELQREVTAGTPDVRRVEQIVTGLPKVLQEQVREAVLALTSRE